MTLDDCWYQFIYLSIHIPFLAVYPSTFPRNQPRKTRTRSATLRRGFFVGVAHSSLIVGRWGRAWVDSLDSVRIVFCRFFNGCGPGTGGNTYGWNDVSGIDSVISCEYSWEIWTKLNLLHVQGRVFKFKYGTMQQNPSNHSKLAVSTLPTTQRGFSPTRFSYFPNESQFLKFPAKSFISLIHPDIPNIFTIYS
jgi:hypothetical protein